MDITSGAGRVISSVLILSLTLLFSFLIALGFDLSITAAVILSFVFMPMVIEDYMYMTIDIRILGILAFTGIFATNYGMGTYFFLIVVGLVYYRIIYLFLIKYGEAEHKSEPEANKPEAIIDSSQALGFLPSIASGIVIYAFYRIVNPGNQPLLLQDFYDSCNVVYTIFVNDPLYLVVSFLPFIVLWIILEHKRHRAKVNNRIMIPMLGDGDVYVMAVWLAILGIADMTIVLFISCIVQVLALTYRKRIQNKV